MVIDFSDRLRELRLEKGYSQATLSQKITNLGQPLSEAALAKYESGRTIPNLQVAAYLADYFGVSIDYLACGEKASVLSTEGLKEEQIRLLVELIGDQRTVYIDRDLPAEGIVQTVILRRGGQILVSAHDMGNTH